MPAAERALRWWIAQLIAQGFSDAQIVAKYPEASELLAEVRAVIARSEAQRLAS